MAKSTKQFYFSPKGIAQPYCWLQKADTKFKPQGEYKVDLKVPLTAARKLMDVITTAHETNFAKASAQFKASGKRLKEADLPFFEDDEGNVIFKFRCNASYIDKTSQEKVDIILRGVDAEGYRLPQLPAISGGSELKVKFSMLPFAAAGSIGAGIKLQMDSIMLIKLVEYSAGGGKDNSWSDETEEGGFSARDVDFDEAESSEGGESESNEFDDDEDF